MLGAAGGDIPPSQTLYVQNLTEKVKKAPLKKSLYVAFSPFGRVVDIVHCRSNALRGQAWVVFGDVACATAAMAKLQSFPLFDKPMVRALRAARARGAARELPRPLLSLPHARPPHSPHAPLHPPAQRISFAKERSHAIEKLEGKYKPGMKRSAESRAAAAGGGAGGGSGKGAKRARTGEGAGEAGSASAASASAAAAAAAAGGGFPPAAPALPVLSLPSKTLLVQGLPTTLTEEALKGMVRELFGQYAGLVEVRPVAQRGLAFVEYSSEAAAAPALQGLTNFRVDASTTLTVIYAKAY